MASARAANDTSADVGEAVSGELAATLPGVGELQAEEPVCPPVTQPPRTEWDSELEVRFFSDGDELARASWDAEQIAASEEPAAPVLLLTREQVERRSMYRRIVSGTVAALVVFALGSAFARVVFGI